MEGHIESATGIRIQFLPFSWLLDVHLLQSQVCSDLLLYEIMCIHSTSGAMIAMSPTVTLKGAIKFSMKKLVTGGGLSHSTYTGPGELLLAPPSIGDITSIRLSGNETWSVGRDAFLACTERVQKDMKSQGIGKAMFSGEGWFQYKITGSGILWITSLGAIIRKDVSPSPLRPVHRSHHRYIPIQFACPRSFILQLTPVL